MMDPWVALWLLYSALALTALAPVVWWAVTSGQFKDRDRARYLALGPEAVRRYEAERAARDREGEDVHA